MSWTQTDIVRDRANLTDTGPSLSLSTDMKGQHVRWPPTGNSVGLFLQVYPKFRKEENYLMLKDSLTIFSVQPSFTPSVKFTGTNFIRQSQSPTVMGPELIRLGQKMPHVGFNTDLENLRFSDIFWKGEDMSVNSAPNPVTKWWRQNCNSRFVSPAPSTVQSA